MPYKIISLLVIALISSPVMAVDPSEITSKWQRTPFELYLTPKEAYDMKIADPKGILFLDVRNEAEIHYTGIPETVDANIPYRFDSNKWKMKKNGVYGTFVKPKNHDFVAAVENILSAKELNKDSPVIIMCSTGSRAPFAAKKLHKAGFTKVYTQIEGYEGSRAKSGEHKGKRVVNGWKKANLPWTYDLLPEKMYFNFAPKKAAE